MKIICSLICHARGSVSGLNDLVNESASGKSVNSLTNDEYKKVSTEETDPEIKEILKDYSNAIKDASNYFVR